MTNVFVSGGAGFIGSHLVRRLLSSPSTERVTVYDNFSSGKEWHLAEIENDRRLFVVEGDIKELKTVTSAMEGIDCVFHLASNPDIAKAIKFPDVDFWEGTYLTQNILEAMRINGVKKMFYTSGSGVYGERGLDKCTENDGPLTPISTYAASKISGEAMICSYCHMFDIQGFAFRFANVIGPRQTHGVAYDFINKLRENPHNLKILGDGSQSKSYIHVEDVLDAVLLVGDKSPRQYDCFNVATEDYITVRQIADIVTERMGLNSVKYQFSGGDRGWKGDVPIVRFDLKKIHELGWTPKRTSLEAMRDSVNAMLAQ
ncbi:MAG: NAD-dependent epimerase/dehydratase family protein [Sedimentisphaerales bacterium]|nr:NAD-dependent epimerase/dehydratase family protein [Sedimentisphaerales bacterium]